MSLNIVKQWKAFRYHLILVLITILLVIITWYLSKQHIRRMERETPGLGLNVISDFNFELHHHLTSS